jgi:hypothetical protein
MPIKSIKDKSKKSEETPLQKIEERDLKRKQGKLRKLMIKE